MLDGNNIVLSTGLVTNKNTKVTVVSFPVKFFTGKPLRLEENPKEEIINLYFMNDMGEWCLILGTSDDTWNQSSSVTDFTDFFKELEAAYHLIVRFQNTGEISY